MPHGKPRHAAQLPRHVSPFPAETLDSYLRRLAQANRLSPEALRGYIAGGRRNRSVPVDQLAIFAGVPVSTLEHAIAGLDGDKPQMFYLGEIPVHPHATGPACRLCALAHGATQSIWCQTYPEQVICLRHRRWIRSATVTAQPCLDNQPDILQAHKQHLRLVRRFGREEVMLGFAAAEHICRQWHAQRQHDEQFGRRMRIFHGPDWLLPANDPTIAAAAYPQVVALARLLTSPCWRSLVTGFPEDGEALFAQEVQKTVAPGYKWPQPRSSRDPLYRWITKGHWRSFSSTAPR
jgi:TniQ